MQHYMKSTHILKFSIDIKCVHLPTLDYISFMVSLTIDQFLTDKIPVWVKAGIIDKVFWMLVIPYLTGP